MNFRVKYESWLTNPLVDEATKKELESIRHDEKEVEDRFYRSMEFGTAGMRGKIGAGQNRINRYTVSMAAQGFANYLMGEAADLGTMKVAIAHDTRRMSREFALETASVMAANGILAYIFEDIRSTPELSFAVRQLKCNGGVVITASHNPAEYNGFKVYGDDGAQLVPEKADRVTEEVEAITELSMVKRMAVEEAEKAGKIVTCGPEVDEAYLEAVLANLQNKEVLKAQAAGIKVVYSPLHGTGGRPVVEALGRLGVNSLVTVDEQMKADSEFTTVKLPNPEDFAAFELSIKYAEKTDSNVLIATDPDADRVGMVLRQPDGSWRALSGNETGALLTEYILMNYKLPTNPYVISTIVTSGICRKICEANNMGFMDTLTGFKFIGEKIRQFEEEAAVVGDAAAKHFVFGYEESYGYLLGTHARDKDAVVTTALIIEMYAYYMSQGISLVTQLDNVYKKYGYHQEHLKSINLEGKEGMARISAMMETLRTYQPKAVSGYAMIEKIDYQNDDTGLRKSDVLKFFLEDGSWFAARPSGTEPKLKVYFSVVGKDSAEASEKLEGIAKAVYSVLEIQ